MALKLITTHTHPHPEAPPRARLTGSQALRASARADAWATARDRAGVASELLGACARVYAHWRVMLRTAKPVAPELTPQRRAVVLQALEWGYDEETLTLAIDGCACCPWHAGGNKFGRAFDDFGFILASEERIERLAEKGRAFRQRCAAIQARAEEQGVRTDDVATNGPTAEQKAALVEVRRRLAERLRSGG